MRRRPLATRMATERSVGRCSAWRGVHAAGKASVQICERKTKNRTIADGLSTVQRLHRIWLEEGSDGEVRWHQRGRAGEALGSNLRGFDLGAGSSRAQRQRAHGELRMGMDVCAARKMGVDTWAGGLDVWRLGRARENAPPEQIEDEDDEDDVAVSQHRLL
ncbi:unnamed protein product [Lampetra planeri]